METAFANPVAMRSSTGTPCTGASGTTYVLATLFLLTLLNIYTMLRPESLGKLKHQPGCHEDRPFLNSTNVAVMVDTRPSNLLIPVIDNFLTHLPLDWRFKLFLSSENEGMVRNATLIAHWIAVGRILIARAPAIESYPSDYNRLLQSKDFWESLPGEHVLIFQTDSVLCRASPHRIDDFLGYDYVGAPWRPELEPPLAAGCGNGGLSLRRKSKTLEVISIMPQRPSEYEDTWHCAGMKRVGGRVPGRNISMTFSVETTFYDKPFGVHKFWAHISNTTHRQTLYRHCPEALMLTLP